MQLAKNCRRRGWSVSVLATLCLSASALAQDKKPNILMLMQDDTGWADFGCYHGGRLDMAARLLNGPK